jgi:Fic family protein
MALADAKASILALTRIPYQRSWAEKLQEVQLKREIAGTSKIEGADFGVGELEAALKETPEQSFTRSQKQAHAAKKAYRWISTQPSDMPISEDLIRHIHAKIVEGADDDHCPPGRLRQFDENVTFGIPVHRGATGGDECLTALQQLVAACNREFNGHDNLIRALALHYHFASIHPFKDGNGRTARALEAFMLQKSGLKDLLFIAMSNYYYEEKPRYLEALSNSRALNHDLTPFLRFGLKGIALQCERLLQEISTQVSKALFRDVMYRLFNRLESGRKRVIAERQIEILKILLELEEIEFGQLAGKRVGAYTGLKKRTRAFARDIGGLLHLGAIRWRKEGDKAILSLNIEWPTQITESVFFQKLKELPVAKSYPFLQ